MTRIEFHFNTSDRLLHTCRLLRKARAQDLRIAVLGTPATLRQLDQALWRFSATDFLAHCTAADALEVQQASPVHLDADVLGRDDFNVIVNLGDDIPQGFERFERLIEIVANDDHGRSEARQRWKHYKAQGFDLIQHDLSRKTEP
jgi:DNA polymerase-3 subunit chi